MTSNTDWRFRAGYLRETAKSLRKKAKELELEAMKYEADASRCDVVARELEDADQC